MVARSELPDISSHQMSDNHHLECTGEHDNTFGHHVSALASVHPPQSAEPYEETVQQDASFWHDMATYLSARDDPFRDPFTIPEVSQISRGVVMLLDEEVPEVAKYQESKRTEATTSCVPQASSFVSLDANATASYAQTDAAPTCLSDIEDAIDTFQLPSPLLALRGSSSQRTRHVAEQAECAAPIAKPSDSGRVSPNAEVCSAQHTYRDSLAGLGEDSVLDELDSTVTQHVKQNPFVGGPGTPLRASRRSDSIVPNSTPSPPEESLDAIEIPTRATQTLKQKPNEKRKDSLFEDMKHETVYEHGAPSPERCVRLPLRPKPALTKHTSFDSTLSKPILDRVAAKNFGAFRPGSDPSLRQKYFPHTVVETKTSVQCSLPLDLDDALSGNSGSCDDADIFERTVERPSPLHIRKQSSTTLVHTFSSPQTPVSNSTSQAPGSSANRTPSMGDRHQFDLQRAERNARYNAIHSGDFSSTQLADDLALQLAEFENAGPGSKSSTPTCSSGGRVGDKRATRTSLEPLIGKSSSPAFASPVGMRRPLMVLSKD